MFLCHFALLGVLDGLVGLDPLVHHLLPLLGQSSRELVRGLQDVEEGPHRDHVAVPEVSLWLELLLVDVVNLHVRDGLGLQSGGAPVAVAGVADALAVSLPDGIEAA